MLDHELRCAAIILTVWVTSGAGHDYFISSSGNDKADGSTAATPWRTFARLSSVSVTGGDTVHLVAGSVWDSPLVLETASVRCGDAMRGFLEVVTVNATAGSVRGWVVDPSLNNGYGAVSIQVSIDSVGVLEAIANFSRPDLVSAGVAPNPNHGLAVNLPEAAVKLLQTGTHRVDVFASGSALDCSNFSWQLPPNSKTIQCVCQGTPCPCTSVPRPPPITITTTNPRAKRPQIALNGSGVGVTVRGFSSVSLLSIEISHATSGMFVSGTNDGTLVIDDCSFRGVWNRTSIGQVIPMTTRNCGNGWTDSIRPGGFDAVTVSHCLFDNIDVAMQPGGSLESVQFVNNTVTRANGNTILMTGTTDWQIRGCVFSRDDAPRFFQCGTTDIMVGGLGTTGSISNNEIGWRGEHPAAPDGCGIDYEGGSDGVSVINNLIHDSYGAGVMVFGLSDRSRNISNATLTNNIFVRNGARQMSDDRGEIAFMEIGSTGKCANNIFFSNDPREVFVLNERRNGTLELGWSVSNNTIYPISDLIGQMAETPAIHQITYDTSGVAHVEIVSRFNPPRPTTLLYSIDGSWPQPGASGTTTTALGSPASIVKVPRTAALNARFVVSGLLPSLTMTIIVTVPAADFSG